MIRKLSFVLGLVIGYVAGTQASPRQRARVSATVDRVFDDPRLRKLRPGSDPAPTVAPVGSVRESDVA